MGGVERLVFLQIAKKVGPHAHHRPQARVGKALRQDFREALPLALFGADEKLLALVDVKEEFRRLGQMQLVAVARLRRVQKVAQRDLSFEEFCHPA